ncbi:conserved hypothetical protein [delta proteobacterium NaphS2]|nr:conserved hypothetical protein [delta proteobacterium NaphS2]
MTTNEKTRTYKRIDSVVFRKTIEKFGGLSNMAPGFPLQIGDISVRTSEALYQACRFPYAEEIQKMIISQKSPMTAKMKSKPFRSQTRPDWDHVRVKVMRWSLRVKLACNWDKFRNLLLLTADKQIVEDSRRDRFWGAVANDEDYLEGENVLGRLLMEIREELKSENSKNLKIVNPPLINDFLLYNSPLPTIYAEKKHKNKEIVTAPKQLSLFDNE